ncbi:MAG: hypothetical protein COU46_03560 [Candidatus Niyogibacteria bacterium CG10_big_fil_rev_8_21_14_0_10_42_19]|uniref:Type II secretion system protein GspF domain-containing protein n=1 Tax=Candidatus Niyogibacteria bacterium CG10_big_fil_rev_8_21_14_0_10_42_19 TaxID=1974725 RepID=A0A2H0TES9_9BACT|nr:MAG: hypothetical protein COU46_03560 [Candidatus Niyogibacteria bacterium CG10_big_fil_rev_8_21_14_0_10_42_19]
MIFNYQAKTPEGEARNGTINAASVDLAIAALQRRNLSIISLKPAGEATPFYKRKIKWLERVKNRDVVILSRQLSTLFEAKVPVVDSFKILAQEAPSPILRQNLLELLDDLQGGLSMSQSMGRHPDVFSPFYISMVKAGEESGKLEQVFSYMAEYLERSYQLITKAKNALIYPAFIMTAFIGVMVLMMTTVIPRLSSILTESGQAVPVYTQVVISVSDFLRFYGIFLLAFLVVAAIFLWKYTKSKTGRVIISSIQLKIPYIGSLYKKMYLARFTDTLQTLVAGGVPVVHALEISGNVIGNEVYRVIIADTVEAVRSGASISDSLARYSEVPTLVTQMIKVGEETGKLDFILKTTSKFYTQEVNYAVDALVTLIEPLMILLLGAGVGVLVASILIPIYNISSSM